MTELTQKRPRIASLDILRGVIIVVMALDHTKDYFYAFPNYSVTDLTQATVPDFLTRWITHYCAPGFIFLAGTSAFLTGTRRTKSELSVFLLKRGLWLVFIEIFIINLAWRFNPSYNHITLGVLWCIGVCMILMAAIIHIPFKGIMIFGLVLIFGHNALDFIDLNELTGFTKHLWSVLHVKQYVEVSDTQTLSVLYPIIPWVGLMALGYCFGKLFTKEFDVKTRHLAMLSIGIVSIALFFFIRLFTSYGDTLDGYTNDRGFLYFFLELLNCEKYPPSLAYLLMTMGPLILILLLFERINLQSRVFIVFGRVPFFFYIIHIFVIHGAAILVATIGDYDWSNIGWAGVPNDFGYALPGTYLAWLLIVASLYLPCYFFNKFKRNNPEKWWLSYF